MSCAEGELASDGSNSYLEVNRIVNKPVNWLDQEGFYAPPVTLVLLLLDSDKLAKVATGFPGEPLDQQCCAFQSDNVRLMNFQTGHETSYSPGDAHNDRILLRNNSAQC